MSATHDFLEGLLLAASRLSIWGTLMSASAENPTYLSQSTRPPTSKHLATLIGAEGRHSGRPSFN